MFWVPLLFLVPLVLFVVVARRLARVLQQLRDPRRLQELLSADTRTALIEAGMDLDSIDLQELQESEELARRIGVDVQRALRVALLGGALPGPRASAAPARLPELDAARMSGIPFRSGAQPAEQPLLPPPIDQPSGSGLRLFLLLVIVGLTAAVLMLGSR